MEQPLTVHISILIFIYDVDNFPLDSSNIDNFSDWLNIDNLLFGLSMQ